MIEQLRGNIRPKLISGYEWSEDNKKKPIKVVLNNEQDKEKVLNNLQNLEGITEYKGISITDDYTVSERQVIKEFANKASERNSFELENPNFVWRIWEPP